MTGHDPSCLPVLARVEPANDAEQHRELTKEVRAAAFAGVRTAGTNTMSSASASSDRTQNSAACLPILCRMAQCAADSSPVRARPQAGFATKRGD